MRGYLSPSSASEQNGFIVQLQNPAKALITVFVAMTKHHGADDVTHCVHYHVLGIKWFSWC